MEQRWISALLLSLGVAIAGFFLRDGILRARNLERVVDVKGLAERIVKSNEATWHLSFSSASDDMTTLNPRIAKVADTIRTFLLAKGFSAEEIQKNPILIIDNQANQYAQNHKVSRFVAKGSFTVNAQKVDLVTSAAETTDELLKAGVALDASEVRYYFTVLNSIKPEMLKEATQNAREAAVSFAADSGATLSRIKTATQGLFSIVSPNQEYDTGTSVMKKVRVVTQVKYYLD